MPNLDARLAGRVLAEVLDGAPAAIPEFGRMPGHPVAVSSGLFVQLGMLDGDRGARSVLENLDGVVRVETDRPGRSEEHTSELQSLMRISYAVFCLKQKKDNKYRR